jgi:hypothetical protein
MWGLMRWRDDWRRLKVSDDEIQSLSDGRLVNQKTFREEFDKLQDDPLGKIAAASSLTKTRIAELLRDSLERSSRPLVTPFVRSHWADVLVAAALIMISVVIAPPLIQGVCVGVSHLLGAQPAAAPAPTMRVVAKDTIPAFTMIGMGDLIVLNTALEQDRKKILERFSGHYAINAIARDKDVTENAISKKPFDLSKHQVIRIELKTLSPLEGHDLPENVNLLFSSHEAARGGTQIAVVLLALDSTTTPRTAILALTSDQAAEAGKWLGSCDVYLSSLPNRP